MKETIYIDDSYTLMIEYSHELEHFEFSVYKSPGEDIQIRIIHGYTFLSDYPEIRYMSVGPQNQEVCLFYTDPDALIKIFSAIKDKFCYYALLPLNEKDKE